MGGDHAPEAPVAGALEATRTLAVEVLLVGPQDQTHCELKRQRPSALNAQPLALQVVDAPEVIGMNEHPLAAVRSRRRSSIVVGLDLVARGEADAFVTAGNTGAALAAAIFGLRRLEGIERPALGVPFPTAHGPCLLIDVGANADVRARHLAEFAIMGAVYAQRALGIVAPRVGLLSMGEEESKGNLVVQEAHRMLKTVPLRFIGNVEGKDIPAGIADVVVMDGFVGNVLIKFAEGLGASILEVIRSELRSNLWTSLLAAGLIPTFRRVRRRMDYAEYGGAPLLGVNGICIIAHGRSSPRAIRNAIRVAADCVRGSVVAHVREGLEHWGSGVRGQGPVALDPAPPPNPPTPGA